MARKIILDLNRDCMALSNLMEFDHVVRVHPDGAVSDLVDPPLTPTLEVDDHGTEHYQDAGAGWTLLAGYTGQHGYRGPVMHPSEFIGGRLAEDILARPGLYVAIVAEALPLEEDDQDTEPAGWAVAFRELW